MQAQSLSALPVVLALELSPGHALDPSTLSRDQAADVAALVAADLQQLVPAVGEARLALAGAVFDPVEMLRPGFPVWAALEELARRVPRGHLDNVVAFGSHQDRMPLSALQPDTAYGGGSLRLLPLLLLAEPALAEGLSEQLEVELVGRGEAGTRTADWLMRTLDTRLEHARYLSRNDLLAMTCVQYEYVNLGPLWALLEAALLAPASRESALSARGLALRYEDGRVLAQSPAQWLASASGDPAERAHGFAGIVFELRQYAALLEAHQLPLALQSEEGWQVSDGPGYLIQTTVPRVAGPAPLLFGHEAPGLGVVAVTAAEPGGQALGHGYPLAPEALGPLVEAMAARFGVAADLHVLGRVALDANGRLAGPGPSAG